MGTRAREMYMVYKVSRKTIVRCLKAIVLLMSSPTFAANDQWICKEAASIRHSNVIDACGVATGKDEDEARSVAAENAAKEFKNLCDQSSDCRGHKIVVNPKRTTCDQVELGFKCYRMIQYTILSEMESGQGVAGESQGGNQGRPVMEKGLSKAQLIERFGTPDSVFEIDDRFLEFSYINKPFCIEQERCQVSLKDDFVEHFEGIRMEFTDVLKTKTFWEKFKSNFNIQY